MLVGKQFGPFKVEKEIGSGAMGAVFRGVDDNGRRVAIKIIAPALASNERAVERFLRESNVLKRLHHPNIARYLGSGRYRGSPFYIMEFIQGESLDHILARRGRITWEEVVDIGKQLCGALQAAHDAGVIHRDLKPSNLMILPDGTVKLTDFGIAKDLDAVGLTATHSTLGTAAYMSPEQCRGAKDINFKSDLYSMGVMFYELVTGKKPFTSDNPMDVFLMHVKGKFARPSTFVMDLPVWLDTLICQLMEKSPDDRPFNATKVAEELDSIARKVADQTSAGIDRASKRRADVTAADRALDADDLAVARALLGKRKKAKKRPFYTENWFTLSALAGLAATIALVVYLVFLRPADPDALYAEVAALMKSEKLDDHKAAREPIETFLRDHPGHGYVEQMLRWRNQLELETVQFYVRAQRKPLDLTPDEAEAWAALDDESEGRLEDARRRWVKVLTLKSSSDSDQRGWGLYAEKAIGELMQVANLEKDLTLRHRREVEFNQPANPKNDAERFALTALRNDDPKLAIRAWDDLRNFTQGAPDLRLYHLLALKRVRDLQ